MNNSIEQSANSIEVSKHLSRYIICFMLLLNFSLRVFVALRPLEYIDGLTIPDDAYLSLTIARNIAHGQGPLSGNQYTNGFQPLYVFLLAPVFLAVSDQYILPVHISLVILSIFDTLTLYLLLRLVSQITISRFTIVLMAIAWIVNPFTIKVPINGLETSIAGFFIVWSFLHYKKYFVDQEITNTGKCLMLGVICGIGTLARIDTLFLFASLCTMIYWNNRSKQKTALRYLLFILFGFLLTYCPWLFYSQFYTGDLYPISGKAVRFMEMHRAGFTLTFSHWYARTMRSGLGVLISNNRVILSTGTLLFFPALCCGSALLNRWRQQSPLLVRAYVVTGFLFGAFIVYISGAWFYFRTFHPLTILVLLLGGISFIPIIRSGSLLISRFRRYSAVLVPAFLFALFLYCAYTLYIFGVWYFARYLYPCNILFLLVFAMVIDILFITTQKNRTRIIKGFVLGFLLISLNCCTGEFEQLFFSTDTKELGYMNIGIWARNFFPSGTVIGSCQTGGLSYFADNLHVVNLDGVVNKASYEALVQKRSMDYIRDMRIRYIVGWPMNLEYLRDRSSGITRNDLIFVKMIDGFRSLGQEWLVYKVYYAPIPNSR